MAPASEMTDFAMQWMLLVCPESGITLNLSQSVKPTQTIADATTDLRYRCRTATARGERPHADALMTPHAAQIQEQAKTPRFDLRQGATLTTQEAVER